MATMHLFEKAQVAAALAVADTMRDSTFYLDGVEVRAHAFEPPRPFLDAWAQSVVACLPPCTRSPQPFALVLKQLLVNPDVTDSDFFVLRARWAVAYIFCAGEGWHLAEYLRELCAVLQPLDIGRRDNLIYTCSEWFDLKEVARAALTIDEPQGFYRILAERFGPEVALKHFQRYVPRQAHRVSLEDVLLFVGDDGAEWDESMDVYSRRGWHSLGHRKRNKMWDLLCPSLDIASKSIGHLFPPWLCDPAHDSIPSLQEHLDDLFDDIICRATGNPFGHFRTKRADESDWEFALDFHKRLLEAEMKRRHDVDCGCHAGQRQLCTPVVNIPGFDDASSSSPSDVTRWPQKKVKNGRKDPHDQKIDEARDRIGTITQGQINPYSLGILLLLACAPDPTSENRAVMDLEGLCQFIQSKLKPVDGEKADNALKFLKNHKFAKHQGGFSTTQHFNPCGDNIVSHRQKTDVKDKYWREAMAAILGNDSYIGSWTAVSLMVEAFDTAKSRLLVALGDFSIVRLEYILLEILRRRLVHDCYVDIVNRWDYGWKRQNKGSKTEWTLKNNPDIYHFTYVNGTFEPLTRLA